MKKILFILAGLTVYLSVYALPSMQTDSVQAPEGKIKKGWTFGAVPAVTYNSDLGFQYGLVVNLFDYGDGKTYPKYHHNIYLEWSRYTKGSGVNQNRYDSEHLIPGIRVTAELAYLTEQALDFYGFNGYEANFDKKYFDDTDTANYISRMFYHMDRKMFRTKADFQGSIVGKKLRWLAGIEFSSMKLATVDTAKLNKGKDPADKLPNVPLLYDLYKTNGLITADEADGGINTLLKVGIIYDTRDNESNPMKGMWTDIQFLMAPSFLGNGDLSYTKLIFTHRQYFTIVPQRLSFAYRLSYQGKVSGTMPFYMLPFVYNTAPDYTRDGVGGSKSVRGIVRNRVAGDGVAFGNTELRWKFYKGILWNQNLYLALSGFLDGGLVTQKYKLNGTIPPAMESTYFTNTDESLHIGYGGGLHIALNENFVVAADVAKAAKKEDGNMGVYIGLNWLF